MMFWILSLFRERGKNLSWQLVKMQSIMGERLIPGYSTNLGVIIPLDDFTEKNDATFILPGSQNMLESPEEDYFYKNAKRIIAKAGSVIFLNSRLYQINI